MTFEEFLEKCRERDGWYLPAGREWQIRNTANQCPLKAVFGWDYYALGRTAGLNVDAIIGAADGRTKGGKYRKALLGLVK